MRTCSYCGKEYPEDVVQCAIDGAILTQAVPPVLPQPSIILPEPIIPSERRIRLIEVVLVCTIALGASLFTSISSLFQTSMQSNRGASQWAYGILTELTSLALLWYVLQRRSKTFADLGMRWKWSDIAWSLLLCAGGYLAYCITYVLAVSAGLSGFGKTGDSVGDYLFGDGVTVITMAFLCVNPFFEELIARAYLITEVKFLTNSTWMALAVSTLFQAAYHLYQGVPLALAIGANFFLWSLYYVKTNRITPVILAHLYFDVGSTLLYVARH